jgi:hypothetical protein
MYNIPVSISDATAINPTTTFTAGTVFNFGSGSARGDVMTTENQADLSPTATSSASTGGDAASATAVGDKGAKAQSLVVPALILVAGAIAFLVAKKYI